MKLDIDKYVKQGVSQQDYKDIIRNAGDMTVGEYSSTILIRKINKVLNFSKGGYNEKELLRSISKDKLDALNFISEFAAIMYFIQIGAGDAIMTMFKNLESQLSVNEPIIKSTAVH